MGAWDADRLVSEVQRLALRGMSAEELHRELSLRIRRVIPFEAACWHGLDPNTMLLTTANPEELLQGGFLSPETEPLAAGAVVASEYLRDDVNPFAALALRRAPVGILGQATRGRPERSPRYRDFLAPAGTPFEMRAALVTRGRAWGCVVFHRAESSGDFGPRDARLLARLSRPIAEGIRRSVRADAARRPEEQSAPGMLVLSPGDEIELITPPAERLLEPLRGNGPGSRRVPVPVLALAAAARGPGHGPGDEGPPPLHVPTAAGWLTLHASLPDGGRAGRVAVVVQRTDETQAVPLRLEAFGLTPREREIATLVARGLSTSAIAERLVLSPWTVQDHLKPIFEKTGTRSRSQLRAQIFFSENLPGIVARRPLDARGALAPGAPAPAIGPRAR
jgi:DNA-binding CsgD family transcriptional regulator